jgi:hypothetical protein
MGEWLPVVPESVIGLLPRPSQCVARIAAEKAKEGRVMDGCVYLAYRRLGAVLGLRLRGQIERVIYEYLGAIKAITRSA